MVRFLDQVGANPGRSGHRLSLEAGRIVYTARETIAQLFNVRDPLRVVFGANVTEALNLAMRGYLRPGDHVVTSSMEHNSVMRPLRAMAAAEGNDRGGIAMTVVGCSPQGFLDTTELEAAVRPETTMIVLNHGSNVCGSLLPIREAGLIARRHGCLLLVDVAQTAGAYPLDAEADQIDMLAFTGHKALGGPMGTGGLVIGERVALDRFEPLKHGGTGSRSEQEVQPRFLPDMCESGTANTVGLAGLAAGVRWVLDQGVETIREHEIELAQRLIDGLREIPRVVVYGGLDAKQQTATIALNIAGMEPSEVGLRLDDEYELMCRVGLHCAPAAHKTMGTFPNGTVRFGLGAFTTHDDVDTALRAVREIAGDKAKEAPEISNGRLHKTAKSSII
jgi:cysteine desulfurase family protein